MLVAAKRGKERGFFLVLIKIVILDAYQYVGVTEKL